jgi:hypothetical protein
MTVNIFNYKALQNLPKVVFFCLKIYHLAALMLMRVSQLIGIFPNKNEW